MEKRQGTQRRVGISRMACAACRRLKMRCIGAENPPCARCTKAGRFCIVPQSNQQQLQQTVQQQGHASVRHVQDGSAYVQPPIAQAQRFESNFPEKQPYSGQHVENPSRPLVSQNTAIPVSIGASNTHLMPIQARSMSTLSSATNLSTISAVDYRTTSLVHAQLEGRSDIGDSLVVDRIDHNRVIDAGASTPSDGDLYHLSRFFILNLLPQIPVLTESDVADLNSVFKFKRLLVYSMAYAAARFVPGCKAIRAMLIPTIVSISRLQSDRVGHVESSDEDHWTLLQALAVLYNWAPHHRQQSDLTSTDVSLPSELRPEALRSSIETLALRHSLHKSAEEVVGLVKQGTANLRQTFACRKYLYWLWLFSVAHFRSLVSQTPPSIREDATITQAVQLLESLVADNIVRRILARVELCLLWARAGLRERGLGEWWCNLHTQVNLDSTLTLLDDLDTATQRWRQRWCRPEKHSSFDDMNKSGQEGAIDFYYHFTCFCMATYVTRAFQSSKLAESLPLSKGNLLMKTIERGNSFCRFFLELSPLAKSSICFGPEIAFAMVAACCEYLLNIHNSAVDSALVEAGHLSTVRGVAELMLDLGIDDKHSARDHGQHILAKLITNKLPESSPKPQRPLGFHKRCQTWTAGTDQQHAAQNLMSFAEIADEALPVQESLEHRELSSGLHQGITTGSGDGVGLWATYHGGESIGSTVPYWAT